MNWIATNYDDTAWAPGPAPLGRPRAGATLAETVLTPLVTNSARITFYFRSHLNITSLAGFTSIQLSNFVDDGAVFYLNGSEVGRNRMPVATPVFSTLATSITDTAWEGPIFIAQTNFHLGDNVIAVEVHQGAEFVFNH